MNHGMEVPYCTFPLNQQIHSRIHTTTVESMYVHYLEITTVVSHPASRKHKRNVNPPSSPSRIDSKTIEHSSNTAKPGDMQLISIPPRLITHRAEPGGSDRSGRVCKRGGGERVIPLRTAHLTPTPALPEGENQVLDIINGSSGGRDPAPAPCRRY
jgi:hypothetical protein